MLLLLLTAALAPGQVQVSLRPEAEVSSNLVYVDDVADVRGPTALAARVRRIDLAEAPAIGGAGELAARLLEVRLLVAGIANVRLTGAARCLVVRTAPQPLKSRIIQLLHQQYADALARPPEELQIRLLSEIRDPADGAAVDIETRLPQRPQAGVQRATLTLVGRRDGRRQVQTLAHAVETRQSVPLLKRDIRRGEFVRAGDIRWEQQFATGETKLSERDLQQPMIATRDLRAAAPLQSSDLHSARHLPLIRVRSQVVCTVHSGALRVMMPNAIALESGKLGDQVRLKNPTSGREFHGEVVGPGQVRVRTFIAK